MQSFMNLEAANSHYQNECLGAPALGGAHLTETMLPQQQFQPAAPIYSLNP